MASVSPVEAYRMSGKKTGHYFGKRDRTGLKEKMRVVAQKSPGVTRRPGVGEYLAHSVDKAVTVDIITEDRSLFDASDDYMMEDAFCVKTGMTRHTPIVQAGSTAVKSYLFIYGRPHVPIVFPVHIR